MGLIYYFDGHTALNDPNAVFTNTANFIDSDPTTAAASTVSGSVSANYIEAKGTTCPATGVGLIRSVRARQWGTVNATTLPRVNMDVSDAGRTTSLGSASEASPIPGAWVVLTVPAGGWTWSVVRNLEVREWGTGGTFTNVNPRQVEIEVNIDALPNNYQFVKVGDGMSVSERIR